MLGSSEISFLCQRRFFNRSFSIKCKVLDRHKSSFADNPKHRKLLLVSSSDTAPVRGQSYRTHTVVINAGKKGLSPCLDIIALCDTTSNNFRAGQATVTLSLLVSSIFLTSLQIVFRISFRVTSHH